MHREEDKLKKRQPRSEGVRRIVVACSAGLSGVWVAIGCLCMVYSLIHHSRSDASICLFFTLIGGATLYFLPKGVCTFVYWIKDGFDLDKKRDDTA